MLPLVLAGAPKLLLMGGENHRHALQSPETPSVLNWNICESLWVPLPHRSLHGKQCAAHCLHKLACLCPLVPVSWWWLPFSWDKAEGRTEERGLRPSSRIIVQGMISIKTLSKLAQLRHEGVMLVCSCSILLHDVPLDSVSRSER